MHVFPEHAGKAARTWHGQADVDRTPAHFYGLTMRFMDIR